MPPLYLTIAEFCELSRIGRTKAYYLLADKHLSPIKVGKRTLIDREKAEAWLRSQPAATINYSPATLRAAA